MADNILFFKERSKEINNNREYLKSRIKDFGNNIYSSINQINFSVKLWFKTYEFENTYLNRNVNIVEKIKSPNNERFKMSQLYFFNESFIKPIIEYKDMFKILLSAVSYNATRDVDSLEDIYNYYTTHGYLENEWRVYSILINDFIKNKADIFEEDIINEIDDPRLKEEYENYSKMYSNVVILLKDKDESEPHRDYINRLSRALNDLINIEKSSIGINYFDNITKIIDNGIELLHTYNNIHQELINKNMLFDQYFSENENVKINNELISSLLDVMNDIDLRYNIHNIDELIYDDGFLVFINSIDKMKEKELNNMIELLYVAEDDYKYISSMETFLTDENIMSSRLLHAAMYEFDEEIKEYDIPLYRFLDVFSKVYLKDSGLLTNPFYDVFNYYRFILYWITDNNVFINDVLKSLYIFNNKIYVNDDIEGIIELEYKDLLDPLFEVIIEGVNINKPNDQRINESITNKYNTLKSLDYFDIDNMMDIVKNIDVDEIKEINDVISILEDDEHFDLITYSIVEKLLYDIKEKKDYRMIMNSLSEKYNIKTLLYKILFNISMHIIIKEMNPLYETIPQWEDKEENDEEHLLNDINISVDMDIDNGSSSGHGSHDFIDIYEWVQLMNYVNDDKLAYPYKISLYDEQNTKLFDNPNDPDFEFSIIYVSENIIEMENEHINIKIHNNGDVIITSSENIGTIVIDIYSIEKVIASEVYYNILEVISKKENFINDVKDLKNYLEISEYISNDKFKQLLDDMKKDKDIGKLFNIVLGV